MTDLLVIERAVSKSFRQVRRSGIVFSIRPKVIYLLTHPFKLENLKAQLISSFRRGFGVSNSGDAHRLLVQSN